MSGFRQPTRMRISIITAVKNRTATIRHTIESVIGQDYPDIQYIVIDGGSVDGTVDIIDNYRNKIDYFTSEPDGGVYDALNKGLKIAQGDIVGFLHSDDFYHHHRVVRLAVDAIAHHQADIVFGDIVFIDPCRLNHILRIYRSHRFHPDLFAQGWMPAHPSCFIKREVYEHYGLFKTCYKLASDFELLLRFIKINQVKYCYLPEILVCMRPGGLSNRSLANRWTNNQEILQICREQNIPTNLLRLLARYPAKLCEKLTWLPAYQGMRKRKSVISI
ncbi:glycosyltransferase [Leptolyngbyaceae cyanobacterium CCMR0082]|uniref:Glycosyltransferase n=2 Tax=Adonisia turfae TaxID=2950184 RepID=A0A6M0S501_9CYAN|nr:glycosyltransferase family 2 protein [Adonisia turfae]NEZ60859.1 glycosyltransferase [Adonisia turfae CCMR0081]NEZ63604.1 glycosyltransferase [Adonisia turfae CCMR0082]